MSEDISAIFRPSKRRKVFRQRRDGEDEQLSDGEQPNAKGNIGTHEGQGKADGRESSADTLGIGAVRRQQHRRRPIGVGFTASGITAPVTDSLATGADVAIDGPPLSVTDMLAAEAADMGTRFAKQSGFKVEVDKHMMAYIEAEMAQRERQTQQSRELDTDPSYAADSIASTSHPGAALLSPGTAAVRAGGGRSHEPFATSGALEEVDLDAGPSMAKQQQQQQNKPTPRVRLGPDGKPWRGGRRNRRTSDDVARDAAVEALLSEERGAHHQHYAPRRGAILGSGGGGGGGKEHGGAAAASSASTMTASAGSTAADSGTAARPGADEAADERVAAEFKRRFDEAVAERRKRDNRPPPGVGGAGGGGASAAGANTAANGKKKKERELGPGGEKLIANGPKLGGSRSQRAKMHAREAERLRAAGRQV